MSQKQKETVYYSAAGKAARPRKEIAVDHVRQMAPYAVCVWGERRAKEKSMPESWLRTAENPWI